MDELQRTVDELLLLYTLEPETKDIFVEGITDKLMFQKFIEVNGLIDVKVINVHEINFRGIYDEFPNIKSNNRAKLIALNKKLEDNFGDALPTINIIIDRDFDDLLDKKEVGNYLMYTDYNSIELYLYNADTIDEFYKHILHSFPINGIQTIEKFTPVLVDKFFVRFAIYNELVKCGKSLVSFDKTVKIDKKNCAISFPAHDHIQKNLNIINKMHELELFKSNFDNLRAKPIVEVKKAIRGHDYISLFFQFINKIKNDIGLTFEAFERVIFKCLDYKKLKSEKLFLDLFQKY